MTFSIAQVVFDLPVAGPFDYLIPPSLENQVSVGMRVEVLLGNKKSAAVVVALLEKSEFDQLKSIRKILDKKFLLDEAQMQLGYQMSAYYGCSLGDALFTIARGCEKEEAPSTVVKKTSSTRTLHLCPSGDYGQILLALIKPQAERKAKVLILAADQYAAASINGFLKKHLNKEDYVIGARSLVFRSFADLGLVIMIDEENTSFKQEQTPMYETRQVLWMRSEIENIPLHFVGAAPSVEMMYLAQQKQVALKEYPAPQVKSQVVDLNNYKIMLRGILSPALLSPLEKNAAKKKKSILVFNHRGSYAMTRCEGCGFVLKCKRCESPMLYSRTKKQYICRYCPEHLPTETICPTCRKPSWKSFGFGVEHLQKALQDKFPAANIQIFQKDSDKVLKDFDILIGTWALLRFKNQIKAELVAFLDIDSELNRMDMRSCFRAWNMVAHLRIMAENQVLVQSRQMDHYVIRSLMQDKREVFYQEDMKIRKELGFSPFAHQVMINLRAATLEAVEKMAHELHQILLKNVSPDINVYAPQEESVAHKRGQCRLNILLQGPDVIAMISLIKAAQTNLKRSAKVIVTINVDP